VPGAAAARRRSRAGSGHRHLACSTANLRLLATDRPRPRGAVRLETYPLDDFREALAELEHARQDRLTIPN